MINTRKTVIATAAADFQYYWQGVAVMMAAWCSVQYAYLSNILEAAGNWNVFARVISVGRPSEASSKLVPARG